MKKKIAVVTGTRAEYGLLYWLIRSIHERQTECTLDLIVTGAHLSRAHGYTVEAIERDGFPISAKIPILSDSDSAVSIIQALSRVTNEIGAYLAKSRPDVVVVLGDRYEILGAAQAALLNNIPIAHLHGGESSEGAIDESIRHAITKMSHLHFVSSNSYKKRLISMGENRKHVHCVGAVGLEWIARFELWSQEKLWTNLLQQFGTKNNKNLINIQRPYFIVTYHPETVFGQNSVHNFEQILKALEKFENHNVIITKPNADENYKQLLKLVQDFSKKNDHRVLLCDSLGQVRYLSAVKHSVCVIGNSSSGIIEAPALNTMTINIGNRQKGRLMAPSILNVAPNAAAVTRAISRVIHQKKTAALFRSPYGRARCGIGEKILSTILKQNCKDLLKKKFFDSSNT